MGKHALEPNVLTYHTTVTSRANIASPILALTEAASSLTLTIRRLRRGRQSFPETVRQRRFRKVLAGTALASWAGVIAAEHMGTVRLRTAVEALCEQAGVNKHRVLIQGPDKLARGRFNQSGAVGWSTRRCTTKHGPDLVDVHVILEPSITQPADTDITMIVMPHH